MDIKVIKRYNHINGIMKDIEEFIKGVNKLHPAHNLYRYDMEIIKYNIAKIILKEVPEIVPEELYEGYKDGYTSMKSSVFVNRNNVHDIYTIVVYPKVSYIRMDIWISIVDDYLHLNKLQLYNMKDEYFENIESILSL